MWEKYFRIFMTLYIYFLKYNFKNFKYLKILNFSKKIQTHMFHCLRDKKKTSSQKYEGIGEILLNQSFSSLYSFRLL
jgi:hypothetical protein